jgi:hypothetical protein
MSGRFGYPLAASLVIVAVLVPAQARAQCCVASSGCFCDLGGTIKDTCTGPQWEKKTTAVGSGVNAADLHDVDNRYTWAGQCTVGGAKCQPNAAAAATCMAHSLADYRKDEHDPPPLAGEATRPTRSASKGHAVHKLCPPKAHI